jgi:maltose O-acetyltransferase
MEKNLLPEVEYTPWIKEQVDERMRAMGLCLKFNTTGDKTFLEELFGRKLDDVTIFAPLHCNYGGDWVKFGHRVFINYNCSFQPAGGVEFGDDVYVGSDVRFYTTQHPVNPEERITGVASTRPIRIGSKVWIGGGVTILPGVEIGEGSTIGAGSVVVNSIPPRSVAVGNPARVVKKV